MAETPKPRNSVISPISPTESRPPVPFAPSSTATSRSNSTATRRSSFSQWLRGTSTSRWQEEDGVIYDMSPCPPQPTYVPYRPCAAPQISRLDSTYSFSAKVEECPPQDFPPTDKRPTPIISLPQPRNSSRLACPFTPPIPDSVLLHNTGNAPAGYTSRSVSNLALRSYPENDRSMKEPPSTQPRPKHTILSVIRIFFRFFIIVTSAIVLGLLSHSLSLFDAFDLPAEADLTPSILLMVVAMLSVVNSALLVVVSGVKCKWPAVQLGPGSVTRVIVGGLFVGAWIAGIGVFKAMENSGDEDTLGSLSGVACYVEDEEEGFGAVCTAQRVAFWLAVMTLIAESLCVVTLLCEKLQHRGRTSPRASAPTITHKNTDSTLSSV